MLLSATRRPWPTLPSLPFGMTSPTLSLSLSATLEGLSSTRSGDSSRRLDGSLLQPQLVLRKGRMISQWTLPTMKSKGKSFTTLVENSFPANLALQHGATTNPLMHKGTEALSTEPRAFRSWLFVPTSFLGLAWIKAQTSADAQKLLHWLQKWLSSGSSLLIGTESLRRLATPSLPSTSKEWSLRLLCP